MCSSLLVNMFVLLKLQPMSCMQLKWQHWCEWQSMYSRLISSVLWFTENRYQVIMLTYIHASSEIQFSSSCLIRKGWALRIWKRISSFFTRSWSYSLKCNWIFPCRITYHRLLGNKCLPETQWAATRDRKLNPSLRECQPIQLVGDGSFLKQDTARQNSNHG